MQKRIIVLMSSVFFILLFITTSVFALTYNQRVEKHRYWKNAYETNKMIYRVSDKELSELGVTQIQQKYGRILKDRNGVYVALTPQEVIKNIRQNYERQIRREWEEAKRHNPELRDRVERWIKKEEKALLDLKEKPKILAQQNKLKPQNEQRKSKNTIYIAAANQHIINAKAYIVYFESKNTKHKWRKRAASAKDLIDLFPIWTKDLEEGCKVVKIEAELHNGGTKTYNNVWVQKGR